MLKYLALVSVLVWGVTSEAVKEKTACELHRERESRSSAPLPMRLIPECESNGDYKSLQCFRDSKFCACWDKTGSPVTQPSTKVKACECVVQKHEAQKIAAPGTFIPQCEEDGKFKKQQCSGSSGYCWCAHSLTGEKTNTPARGTPQCD